MDDLTIRDAEPRDDAAIDTMTLRLVPDDPVERDPDAFRRYFAQPGVDRGPDSRTVVICGPDDVPLGYLVVKPEVEYFTGERRSYIGHLAVAAGAEGRGIGQRLLDWAEGWARDEGFAVLSLDVFAGNDRARRLYARNGFRDDFVRMVRRLPDPS